jgi:hypothetical protein
MCLGEWMGWFGDEEKYTDGGASFLFGKLKHCDVIDIKDLIIVSLLTYSFQ